MFRQRDIAHGPKHCGAGLKKYMWNNCLSLVLCTHVICIESNDQRFKGANKERNVSSLSLSRLPRQAGRIGDSLVITLAGRTSARARAPLRPRPYEIIKLRLSRSLGGQFQSVGPAAAAGRLLVSRTTYCRFHRPTRPRPSPCHPIPILRPSRPQPPRRSRLPPYSIFGGGSCR